MNLLLEHRRVHQPNGQQTLVIHKAIRYYGHNPKIWPSGHMALYHLGMGLGI